VVDVKAWESVFHVLKFEVLPPLFLQLYFLRRLILGENGSNSWHYARKSILRKRVYSFKHSGILRGRHRGPENMRVFWQSEA